MIVSQKFGMTSAASTPLLRGANWNMPIPVSGSNPTPDTYRGIPFKPCFSWFGGQAAQGKIIVKIFVSMAAADGNAVPVLLTHMKNVIPCGAVPYDPATAAQPACTSVVLLENRVVEYKHKHRASPIDSP